MLNNQKYLHPNSTDGILHKKWLCILSTIFIHPLHSYATAGFYERMIDYNKWLYPAYKYCCILWLFYFLILNILYILFNKPLTNLLSEVTNYLRSKEALTILVFGICIAIPIGMLSFSIDFIFDEYLGILSLGPLAFIPIMLDSKKYRNNIFILWISFILTISVILACISFIILTNSNVLFEVREKIYDTVRSHCEHPYGSLISILSLSICGIFIVIIYFIGYWLNRFRFRNTSYH